jgi:DNA-binding beta-propeller fold protein YncE
MRQTILDATFPDVLPILKSRRILQKIVGTVAPMLGAMCFGSCAVGKDYYVTSAGNNIVMKATYQQSGSYDVQIFAGTNGSAGNVDGIGTAAKFNNPRGIVASPNGKYLYVADLFGDRIRRVEVATGAVTTIAGNNTTSDVDGVGTAASFNHPTSLDIDPTGQMLFVTTFSGIRLIMLSSLSVTTLLPKAGFSSAEQVYGVKLVNKRLYFTTSSHYLKSIDLEGKNLKIEAGNGTANNVDGYGQAAAINQPWGLAYDGVDTLYIVSYAGNQIRAFNTMTTEVYTIAGTGIAGSLDGIGSSATFDAPNDVAIDNDGRLIVAQNNNTNLRFIV